MTKQNPWKEKSKGLPVVMVPLNLFTDDVSGTNPRSGTNLTSGLCYLLVYHSRLENIHFICASNQASCLQTAEPIVEDLLVLENDGVVMFDSLLAVDVLVVAPVLCIIADNP